jgi:hypothetical protein
VRLTVIANATQTHVRGAKNWATVKKASDDVIVQATTDPDTPDCWNKINWSGDSGTPVAGHPNQRQLSRAASKKYHVEAELGGVNDHVDVWVLWADLVITIGTGDTIDSGNDASFLAAGHNWPAHLGGGNKLGPLSKEGTTLTYAYTVGKMQAKATLTPPGIEDVIDRSSWHIKRKVTVKAWDNGVSSVDFTDHDDTSDAFALDVDPKSGTSTREIYDIDAPGCSTVLGTTITHTSEVYANFTQHVTVSLDTETKCSDDKTWSYVARVDVDKASGKVEQNDLSLSHVAIPGSPQYPHR